MAFNTNFIWKKADENQVLTKFREITVVTAKLDQEFVVDYLRTRRQQRANKLRQAWTLAASAFKHTWIVASCATTRSKDGLLMVHLNSGHLQKQLLDMVEGATASRNKKLFEKRACTTCDNYFITNQILKWCSINGLGVIGTNAYNCLLLDINSDHLHLVTYIKKNHILHSIKQMLQDLFHQMQLSKTMQKR